MAHIAPHSTQLWGPKAAPRRWYAFGRYYAMFPRDFLISAVSGLTAIGDVVLDPFCGRGNAPFVATVLQRRALAIDNHPIAWLFAAAKQHPAPDVEKVLQRLREVSQSRSRRDSRSRSRFETMAWTPPVRALLRAARRELDWRDSVVDRTLMAFIALHMQDKRGDGLSNSLAPTIAYSPDYAVRWWTATGMPRPPDVDPVALLTDKIRRRYLYGVPDHAHSEVLLADSREALPAHTNAGAKLLITSPPYCGVTDYWNDHWIRLWLLGHSLKKNWAKTTRFSDQDIYRDLISHVLYASKNHLTHDATILIRSDQRRHTAQMCIQAMRAVWPHREILARPTIAPHCGTSNTHGRGGTKAREIDLLIPSEATFEWAERQGFVVSTADQTRHLCQTASQQPP